MAKAAVNSFSLLQRRLFVYSFFHINIPPFRSARRCPDCASGQRLAHKEYRTATPLSPCLASRPETMGGLRTHPLHTRMRPLHIRMPPVPSRHHLLRLTNSRTLIISASRSPTEGATSHIWGSSKLIYTEAIRQEGDTRRRHVRLPLHETPTMYNRLSSN